MKRALTLYQARRLVRRELAAQERQARRDEVFAADRACLVGAATVALTRSTTDLMAADAALLVSGTVSDV
jgi:hypothetical protein